MSTRKSQVTLMTSMITLLHASQQVCKLMECIRSRKEAFNPCNEAQGHTGDHTAHTVTI